MTPHDFLSLKMALSARFGYKETSGYRSAYLNKRISGAVEDSLHQCWLASDIVLNHPDEKEKFIRMAERLGLRAIDEGDHIHLQAP